MRLSQAAAITRGTLRGSDCLFDGVAIDSRRISHGDLFVAIRGERHDGHDFIDQAGKKGAAGALVCGAGSGTGTGRHAPRITVDDTTVALGQLGAHWRSRFTQPVVAVTGSNGKTTVSALIASILNRGGNCLSPRASFNNQWGVPLTLLRMREHHTHVVIEMGMNHPGEIEYLSGLAKPDIALINNVAPAHLAGLVDLESIADAKAEIFSGLAPAGTAVLNADDPFYGCWLRCVRANKAGVDKVVSFGLNQSSDVSADVSATEISGGAGGSAFELNIKGQRIRVVLPLPGRHNVSNAVAAAAAAHAAGAGLEQIRSGLESFTALNGRLCPLDGLNGALIIDDSYNANPASTMAALDVLAGFGGERIAVLGPMAELGEQSDDFHYQVGAHGRRCGIDRLMCLGMCPEMCPEPADHSKIANYVRGFGPGAECFDNLGDLLDKLAPMLASGVTVLVKGSRSAAMERVVSKLVSKPEGGPRC